MIQSSSSCTLPSISNLLTLPCRSFNSSPTGMNQHHPMTINTSHDPIGNTNATNSYHHHHGEKSGSNNKISGYHPSLKAKRKRASPSQLAVLNQVFSQTYFPSTELRIELGKHLGMSPRTVQIWFQNKRQSLRSRTRRYSFSSVEGGEIEVEGDENTATRYYTQHSQYDMAGSPSTPSPLWSPTYGSNSTGNNYDPFTLPLPPSTSGSSSPLSLSSFPIIKDDDHYCQPQHHHQKVNLPPLRLQQGSYYPPSPPSSTYSSPISIDSILH